MKSAKEDFLPDTCAMCKKIDLEKNDNKRSQRIKLPMHIFFTDQDVQSKTWCTACIHAA